MFWTIVICLVGISFVMSLVSLWGLLKKHPEVQHASDELAKGKVLFQRDSSIPSPDDSE